MTFATALSEAGASGLRRCASSPALRDPETSGLEVYVLCRPFSEFGGPLFHGLPPGAKGALTQMGVCHFVRPQHPNPNPGPALLDYARGHAGGSLRINWIYSPARAAVGVA